jgi:hypothetical protein
LEPEDMHPLPSRGSRIQHPVGGAASSSSIADSFPLRRLMSCFPSFPISYPTPPAQHRPTESTFSTPSLLSAAMEAAARGLRRAWVTGTGEQRSRKSVKRGGGVGAGRAEEREGFGQCGQGSGNLAKTKARAGRRGRRLRPERSRLLYGRRSHGERARFCLS